MSKLDPKRLGSFAVVLWLLCLNAHSALQISVTDLNPPGATSSTVNGLSENQQAGKATLNGVEHAVIWSGTAASCVDLHPAGADSSFLQATIGSQQVGVARFAGVGHAATWYGAPDSFVDLHPPGARTSSIATALNSTVQGGSAVFATRAAGIWFGDSSSFDNLAKSSVCEILGMSESQEVGDMGVGLTLHASLWSGTPDSVLDLHPTGASASKAYAVLGDEQVGEVQSGGVSHATLWHGTSDSALDLHPVGATWSVANGLIQDYQSGYARFNGFDHAALWAGTAASFVDLHSVLSSDFTNSWAKGICASNALVLVAGFATLKTTGQPHAILWTIRPVAALPSISVLNTFRSPLGTVLTLAWPDAGSSYLLEKSSDLAAGWEPVTAPWTTNSGTLAVTVTNSVPTAFYRLKGQ